MKKKDFFNQISSDWEKEHNNKDEMERTRIFVKHFNLKLNETVLDVGCGTGRLIPFIKDFIGQHSILIELDFSEEMLKIGSGKYNFHNLFFLRTDAHKIALRNNLFTTVICMALFPHLNDKTGALREFYRLLQPGGQLIISHQMSRDELNQFHKEVKGPVTKDLLPDDREMNYLFTDAGFRNISIKNETGLYIARGNK